MTDVFLLALACSASYASIGTRQALEDDVCPNLEQCLEALTYRANAAPGIDGEEQQISEAVEAFGSTAIPGLLRLLEHEDERVRELAGYTVGGMEGISEVHLERLMDARLRGVGWLPAAIARIGTPQAIEFLASELEKEKEIRTQVTFAFELLGEKGVPYLAEPFDCNDDCDEELLSVITFIFGEMKSEARPAIPSLLFIATDSSRSPTARQSAIAALAAIGPAARSAVPELRDIARSDPEEFNEVVTRAIVGIGGSPAADILIDRLAAEPDLVTIRELAALGSDARHAGTYLVECLEHEDWEIRLGAARALGYVDDAGAVDRLVEMLAIEEDWRLAAVSAESLGRLRAEQATTDLDILSRVHWYPPVRETAEKAIAAIDGRAEYEHDDSTSFSSEFFEYHFIGKELEPCPATGDESSSRLSASLATELQYVMELEPLDSEGSHARRVALTPQVGLSVRDGWLVGSDRGEWGGELVFLGASLEQQVILEERVRGVFEMSSGIVALTSRGFWASQGLVYRVSRSAEGNWSAVKRVSLPGAPDVVSMKDNGVLRIDGSGGSVLLFPDGELQLLQCEEQR